MWLKWLVSGFNRFQFVQEVVDATLLEKVETSIERNKSLQMLYIDIRQEDVLDAILNGARGNTSLKQLTVLLHDQERLKAAAAELRQVRPQLKFIYWTVHAYTIGFMIIVINLLITFGIT